MKKPFLFALLLCAALLLAACGGSKGNSAPTTVTPRPVNPGASSVPAPSPASPETDAPVVPPTPDPEPSNTPDDDPGGIPEIWPGRVFADYLDKDVMPAFYDAFVADDGEYSVQIVYSSNTIVTDVRVLSLVMTDYVDGKAVYDETELYRQEQLSPDCPLIVTLVFAGDLPNNGISFVDAAGDAQRFALYQSGKDGSLILEAY